MVAINDLIMGWAMFSVFMQKMQKLVPYDYNRNLDKSYAESIQMKCLQGNSERHWINIIPFGDFCWSNLINELDYDTWRDIRSK